MNWTHALAAVLLLTLAMTSVALAVLIAVKPGADRSNSKMVRKANAVGLGESIALGIVTITGLIAVFRGPWQLSDFWLWMGLVVVVFYGLALRFLTKPARMAVADGSTSEGKVGMQVCLQIGHFLLVMLVFISMMAKPV